MSYGFPEYLKAEIDVETRNFVGILWEISSLAHLQLFVDCYSPHQTLPLPNPPTLISFSVSENLNFEGAILFFPHSVRTVPSYKAYESEVQDKVLNLLG